MGYFIIIVSILLIPILLYFLIDDEKFFNFLVDLNIKLSKLHKKEIATSRGKVSYLEGGEKNNEILILLHGITADKNQWPLFAKKFLKKYRVIAFDLPPFGESDIDWNFKYTIKNQAVLLKEILEKLNVEKLHIVGNSMGGGVAIEFTLQNHNRVKSLALFDTMGIYSAKRTEFLEELESGEKNFLLINSFDDIDVMYDSIFYKAPFTPKKIKRVILKLGKRNYKINDYVFENLLEESYWLENEFHKIDIPTFILWGKNDKIFDVSSVEVITDRIKNTKVKIIDKCGHLPMFERPKESALAYQNFLNNI